MAQEFYNFDEALDQLNLKEEELKRLVSEGEIRAFRKGDTMKLRRSDVESLRAELSGGDVMELGEATEELVFEDDTGLEEDTGMATQEIADVDTLIEEDIEDVGELELEEEVSTPAPVRRQSALAAAVVEDESESMALRGALILTAVVMVLVLPLLIAIASGEADDLANSVAGIWGFGKGQ